MEDSQSKCLGQERHIWYCTRVGLLVDVMLRGERTFVTKRLRLEMCDRSCDSIIRAPSFIDELDIVSSRSSEAQTQLRMFAYPFASHTSSFIHAHIDGHTAEPGAPQLLRLDPVYPFTVGKLSAPKVRSFQQVKQEIPTLLNSKLSPLSCRLLLEPIQQVKEEIPTLLFSQPTLFLQPTFNLSTAKRLFT